MTMTKSLLHHRHYAFFRAAILLMAISNYIPRCQAFGIAAFPTRQEKINSRPPRSEATISLTAVSSSNNDESSSSSSTSVQSSSSKAPTLNGKMVLPYKVIKSGLKGHAVAAVYAVLNANYKRGSGDGWEHCEYVGVTGNLDEALQLHAQEHDVAHVRALSFSFPQPDAMKEIASQWKAQVQKAGGTLNDWNTIELQADENRAKLAELMEHTAFYDDEDDEWDEEEEELRMEMQQQQLNGASTSNIISPFEKNDSAADTVTAPPSSPSLTEETLTFTKENVDKVLDEVRPYLIADGGNVAVQSVDEQSQNVYLVLEGACGSCASSTVTMQMGIERVLKEKFPELNEVIQVEDPAIAANKPTELTLEAVQAEVNRIKPAIVAMGGVVEIVKVDPIGSVVLKFNGSNKVRQGLELAIRDVEYVKHVEFVM